MTTGGHSERYSPNRQESPAYRLHCCRQLWVSARRLHSGFTAEEYSLPCECLVVKAFVCFRRFRSGPTACKRAGSSRKLQASPRALKARADLKRCLALLMLSLCVQCKPRRNRPSPFGSKRHRKHRAARRQAAAAKHTPSPRDRTRSCSESIRCLATPNGLCRSYRQRGRRSTRPKSSCEFWLDCGPMPCRASVWRQRLKTVRSVGETSACQYSGYSQGTRTLQVPGHDAAAVALLD